MGLFGALFNPQTLIGAGLATAGAATGNPALIGAGIGAGLGGIQGSMAQQEAEKQRKAQIGIEQVKGKFSPFTGERADFAGAIARTPIPDPTAAAISGGLTGLAIGSQFEGGADPVSKSPKPSPKVSAPAGSTAVSSPPPKFSNLQRNLQAEAIRAGGIPTASQAAAGAPGFTTSGISTFFGNLGPRNRSRTLPAIVGN